jgi:hypothetical protein
MSDDNESESKNINVHLSQFGKLATAMWDTLGNKFAGSLVELWLSRRTARAKAEASRDERLVAAQTDLDVEAIKSGKYRVEIGKRIALVPAKAEEKPQRRDDHLGATTIESVAASSRLADDVRRAVNIANAILVAEEVLEADASDAPKEKIRDDWFYRWRDSAAEVSSAELQDLWGRILAGEVRAPGSFALRTLDFIRNLSPDEAKVIAKLSKFVLAEQPMVWCTPKRSLDKYDLQYTDANLLEMLGIIGGVDALSLGYEVDWAAGQQRMFALGKNALVAVNDGASSTNVSIPVWTITPMGLQVLTLCEAGHNYEFFNDFASFLADTGLLVCSALVKNQVGPQVTVGEIRPFRAQDFERHRRFFLQG